MKTLSTLVIVASMFVAASSAYAEAPHGHDHDAPIGGPKGGRLLEDTEPHAEFLVEKDLSVTVTFYDEDLKPVAAAEQHVSVIAEAEGKKTTLDFEKQGDVLVSKGPLPQEHALNLVVRFQQTPDDTARNFRFVYEDHICDVCKRAEYACICGH
jgi:hypothetical protein